MPENDRQEQLATCVICGLECRPREQNRYFPFCSQRCQLVDLGRWLDGDYRIPSPDGDGDGEALS